MRWDDGARFTAEDLAFTGEVFKKFRIPRYYAYWESVERIVAPDKEMVQMTLQKPTAIFARRTLSSFVVQKKRWEPLIRRAEALLPDSGVSGGTEETGEMQGEDEQAPIPQGALKMIQAHMVSDPTGLGPFMFTSREKGAYILLVRFKREFHMFIIGWRGLSLDPDHLRRFFHSSYDAPNQWDFTGYNNAEFNRLAEMQMQTLDLG